jgi:hypothetical protein
MQRRFYQRSKSVKNCYRQDTSSSHIKPGEKGKITTKINTKGRTGPISKGVQVFSNDPKRHIVKLFLRATIQP